MSETWQVILARRPKRIMRRLPADLRRRILAKLHDLEDDPRPAGCVRMAGYGNLYRIRVGGWRITYAVEEGRLIVLVVDITPRGGAYRGLS